MTDPELKSFLAAKLPERIIYSEKLDRYHWRKEWMEHVVLDTEWEHIVRLVELSLTEEQHASFGYSLWRLTERKNSERLNRDYLSASWQQRATALARMEGRE